MPEISRFFGIVIRMYYNDHEPPHFHAVYGDDEAVVGIESLVVLRGSLPPRAMGMVIEWGVQHRFELMAVWRDMRASQPSTKIEPLQ